MNQLPLVPISTLKLFIRFRKMQETILESFKVIMPSTFFAITSAQM
jgi:hypothetical protein